MLILLSTKHFIFAFLMLSCGFIFGHHLEINWLKYLMIFGTFLRELRLPDFVQNILRASFSFTLTLLDICIQYCIFVIYICIHLFSSISDVLVYINPGVYQCVAKLISVLSWILIQIIGGFFFQGTTLINTVSWLMVLCSVILYLDTKYNKVKNNYSQENENNLEREVKSEERHRHEEINITEMDDLRLKIQQESFNHKLTALRRRNTKINQNRHSDEHQFELRNRIEDEMQENHNFNGNVSEQTQNPPSSESEENSVSEEENVTNSRNSLLNSNSKNIPALCCICMKEKRDVAVFPCGHTHCCRTCVLEIMTNDKKCPICMEVIQQQKHIFL